MIKRTWWAGEIGEETYDLACDQPTREAAIYAASEQLAPGTKFQIIEAAPSRDAKHDGADFVPLVHARNHEIVEAAKERN